MPRTFALKSTEQQNLQRCGRGGGAYSHTCRFTLLVAAPSFCSDRTKPGVRVRSAQSGRHRANSAARGDKQARAARLGGGNRTVTLMLALCAPEHCVLVLRTALWRARCAAGLSELSQSIAARLILHRAGRIMVTIWYGDNVVSVTSTALRFALLAPSLPHFICDVAAGSRHGTRRFILFA